MANPASIIFLVLFALTTLFTYLSVRRRWASLAASFAFGAVGSALCFVLFMLSQNNSFGRALLTGVLIGLVFSGLTVSAAAYFRANSSARPALPDLREHPSEPASDQ
ncbi:MAG: hypothetical protein DYG88_06430 [Chloroflexi bacterium CFX4]|nr:hypothetical protein [Chloroflexi bacterium CFX4]MDL1922754.1 hypothetical protein [Chloroflexi bacterium CFX3]